MGDCKVKLLHQILEYLITIHDRPVSYSNLALFQFFLSSAGAADGAAALFIAWTTMLFTC